MWRLLPHRHRRLRLGGGTESDPYLISSLNNLYWLSQTSSEWGSGKYFKQTADIDAAGTTLLDNGSGLAPIGNNSSNFKGVYDGGGHVIDGLVMDRSTEEHVGMFGYTRSAVIKNLGLDNASIKGKGRVGGLVGLDFTSTITGCFTKGSVESVGSSSGGWFTGGYCGCGLRHVDQ